AEDRKLELALDVAGEVVRSVEELEAEGPGDAESEAGDQGDQDRQAGALIVWLGRRLGSVDDTNRIQASGRHLEGEIGFLATLLRRLQLGALVVDEVLELLVADAVFVQHLELLIDLDD